MAERVVSPGVFTNEKDLSFLPQGIDGIGAALIGPTLDGPAFVPTTIRNFGEFEDIFGKETQDFYVPFAAKQYLRNAGNVTIVRVMGLGGYANDTIALSVSGSTGIFTLATLKPSRANVAVDLTSTALSGSVNVHENFGLTVGGTSYQLSFDSSSANYIGKTFSEDAQDNTKAAYLYSNLSHTQNIAHSASIVYVTNVDDEPFSSHYSVATTPSITSQLVSNSSTELFKVNTRSHGTSQNTRFRIGISDVKPATDVAGSDYGTFSLQVVRHNPGQTEDGDILENFSGINFDEDSVNFLPRVIGDTYTTVDNSTGKLTNNGNYPNRSKYVYISDYGNLTGISKELVPMGFGKLTLPHSGSAVSSSASFPTASLLGLTAAANSSQVNSRGTFDQNAFYGFDFGQTATSSFDNNSEYLAPLPSTGTGTGNNVTMSLENCFGHDDASTLGATYANGSTKISLTNSALGQRKFQVPFQGGFDGDNPAKTISTGTDISATNSQGFDLSAADKSGSVAFKNAITAISNPDEFDINLLATPGVIHSIHPSVTNHAIDKVEDRADTFYIMDGSHYSASVQNAIDDVAAVDSNYAATYYPWVKVLDSVKGKPTWVPPSVVLPGVYAQNDRIGQEWFAPAGLNRGGLTEVLEAKTRLTNLERDDLYESRVNPIATFPGQGVVVFGQKTLQGKPSALDRINVRRLLINLRKFIASTSRFLVFEQNNSSLRNRFLNIVNPYMEQVQANAGLTAFRVVMDESNNTPDVVDRNQLVGQIFIQPTRTAEFIVLDFVVQPTGAAFQD